MKTMREVDDEHRPSEFVKRFGHQTLDDGVAMVIDISHESPVYNPSALEEAGVEYHKFPTVSKQVPRAEEVEQFVALVDELRQTPKLNSELSGTTPTIAVHCHYGYGDAQTYQSRLRANRFCSGTIAQASSSSVISSSDWATSWRTQSRSSQTSGRRGGSSTNTSSMSCMCGMR